MSQSSNESLESVDPSAAARPPIAVVGNGPGGCALASCADALGHPVRLLGRSSARAEAAASNGGITFIEGEERRLVTGVLHTTDPAVALEGVREVIVAVPTSALPTYGALVAPHLRPDARVLLAPGHTGGALAFRKALLEVCPELNGVVIGETFTLPFVTRMTAPAEVTVWRRMSNLLAGVLPRTSTDELIATFSELLPDLVPASSVLETSLSNANAVMHPPGMVLNAGWIEATEGGFKFYAEGVTPGVGAVIAAVDAERLAIAAAYGLQLPTFLEVFCAAGLTTPELRDSGDVSAAIRGSVPNELIQAPSSMLHRYVEEDIGCGLVAMQALAEVAGVPTPTIDTLVTLAGMINGKDYSQAGLNAAALGIDGLSRDQVLELV